MITVTVTSDSSVPELRVAERTLADLIKLAMEKPTLSEIAEYFKVPPKSEFIGTSVHKVVVDEIAEQAKAEFITAEMVKSYAITTNCSTVKAEHDLNNGGSVHIQDNDYVTAITPDGVSHVSRPSNSQIFNSTELAEAETLGKPVCSTVDASQSTTAPVDIQANTSLPEPTSVFGQPAQTAANVANPAAPATDDLAADADGLTWDSRIHSSSKEFNKDGTWRKRRGVNTDLVMQVEAELRQRVLVTKALANVKSPTTYVDQAQKLVDKLTQYEVVSPIDEKFKLVTPTTDEGLTLTEEKQVTVISAPKPPASDPYTTPQEVPQPVMQANPLPTGGSMTFSELLDGVTKAMVAGQLTQARITEALKSIGIEALPHLIARTDLIPAFREALGGVV